VLRFFRSLTLSLALLCPAAAWEAGVGVLDFPRADALAPWTGSGFTVTTRARAGAALPWHAESGEQATGSLRSPTFTITGSRLTLRVNGWDGIRSSTAGRNEIRLLAMPGGTVLRGSSPPNTDNLSDLAWFVGDLVGRQVAVELVDGCAAGGYAWLGIESIRQVTVKGPSPYKIVGTADGTAFNRQAQYVTHQGIPLAAAESYPLANGKPLRCGFRARILFFLTHCPLLPLGTDCGILHIRYRDGGSHVVPLVCGATTWPDRPGAAALEGLSPIRMAGAGSRALARSVHVRASGLPDQALLALDPGAQPISEISLTSADASRAAVVTGVTALTDDTGPNLVPCPEAALLGHPEGGPSGSPERAAAPMPALVRWLNARCLRLPADISRWQDDLAALAHALRPPDEDDVKHPPAVQVPPGFTGPRVEFRGNVYAQLLTNIYYGTVMDMAGKVDPDGTFHTSSKGAHDFGSPWLWQPGAQPYYNDAWSRDQGRVLMELVDLGYQDKAEGCLAFTDRCLFLPARPAEMSPRHWPMVMNNPNSSNPETDGHGLQMLFHYRAWLHAGRKPEWVKARWKAIQEAADYLTWCLDHPELSKSQHGLIFSATEAVGVYMEGGFGLYCDIPCILGLRGYAKMAQTAGRTDLAARWRQAADGLAQAISAYYPAEDPKYGPVWDRERSRATPLFWGTGNAALAPLIIGADYLGFDAADRVPADWRERTANTYRRQTDECQPAFACFNGGLGYTHCFLTQTAQLLDRMGDAAQMLRWLALVTYDPRVRPFIVPEVGYVSADGRQWGRRGDQGNGVQEGEAIKCLRLVLGIDDLIPERTTLIPRLPEGWTLARAQGYPVVTVAAGRTVTRRLDYTYQRLGAGRFSLQAAFDRPVARLRVRVGPFPRACKSVTVAVNGRPVAGELRDSGDGRWAWVEVGENVRALNVTAEGR